MSKQIKNMSASVHERLLNQAKQDQRPFNELLQYFAMDRFLYRWSKSKHAARAVLKGALMLRVWEADEYRSTKDIDMLAKNTSNDLEAMAQLAKDVIDTDVDTPDGLTFHSDTVTAERITEDADYEGVRIKFMGNLGNAEIHMQIDVGFGDIVYPRPIDMELPSMLNFPKATLSCYSRESAVAEKFQAMVHLADSNSRMKDFYDIYVLSRQFDFEGKTLAEAIRLTFNNRETDIPSEVSSFRKEFVDMKETQWKAFRKKIGQDHIPESFGDIVSSIEKFIQPVSKAVVTASNPPSEWIAPGSWS
jgi:hypothetical protein